MTAIPNVPRSTPYSSITIGATMPSSCASIPSAIRTSMQTAKVITEKALSGWREIASLKDVATLVLPGRFATGCHARMGLESVNAAIRAKGASSGQRRNVAELGQTGEEGPINSRLTDKSGKSSPSVCKSSVRTRYKEQGRGFRLNLTHNDHWFVFYLVIAQWFSS